MDYRLTIVYGDGSTREQYCSTEMDVSNAIVSIFRSQFKPDMNSKQVTFFVTNLAT